MLLISAGDHGGPFWININRESSSPDDISVSRRDIILPLPGDPVCPPGELTAIYRTAVHDPINPLIDVKVCILKIRSDESPAGDQV